MFQLSQALRGYDWEIVALLFASTLLLVMRLSARHRIAPQSPCPAHRLASHRLASPLRNALSRYRFSIPRLRIVLLTFCLSDPMRLDSSHIVTPRFFSPHFNRSHSTIKSVLSLKS